MKAIAIVGKKKTGKTTMGLALVKKLTERGYKVGVLKHSHHGFDGAEGADTEEYKKSPPVWRPILPANLLFHGNKNAPCRISSRSWMLISLSWKAATRSAGCHG